jgi:hypothetical protein
MLQVNSYVPAIPPTLFAQTSFKLLRTVPAASLSQSLSDVDPRLLKSVEGKA